MASQSHVSSFEGRQFMVTSDQLEISEQATEHFQMEAIRTKHLLLFFQQRTPATTWAEGMRGHLIHCRCHAYNAVDLTHVYHEGNKVHHLRYQVLRAAVVMVA